MSGTGRARGRPSSHHQGVHRIGSSEERAARRRRIRQGTVKSVKRLSPWQRAQLRGQP